jgi:leader peptidase (prepilin peptidase)/N-methyltransferase
MMAFQSPALQILTVVYGLTFAAGLVIATPDQAVLGALLLPVLVWLSLVDLARHEIPDLASASIAVVGLGFQWHLHGPGPVLWATLALALALTALLWGIGALFFSRTGTEALGIGDAKLIGAGALCVGAPAVWLMIFVAATGGIAAALIARRRDATAGEQGLAFGPFLAYAIFLVIFFPSLDP